MFTGLIMYRLLYDLPAGRAFAAASAVSGIDVLLKPAYNWSFSEDIVRLLLMKS